MSETSNPDIQLQAVADTLHSGGPSPRLTVRAFLSWFGAQRRGYWIVRSIRDSLKRSGLRTNPDFESTWIDGPISFSLAEVVEMPATEDKSGPVADSDREPDTGAASPALAVPLAAAPLLGSVTTELSMDMKDAIASEPPEEEPSPEVEPGVGGMAGTSLLSEAGATRQEIRPGDPSHRISKLEEANSPPDRVTPDSTLNEAITIMLTNDYSQVPVMPNDREVKGVVTWQSIGSRLALGLGADTVRQVMDPSREIRADASIFDAIPILIESGYVLVRGSDGRIAGIVTSSDLSLQFRVLAEPFLLLGEIENRIRNIIAERFKLADLESVRDPEDQDRKIESVDDLTMGEYIRLLEQPARWTNADLKVDRRTFIKSLDNIRRIRNDVMHFDTDSIPDEDLESLRGFARFLQQLEALGVT